MPCNDSDGPTRIYSRLPRDIRAGEVIELAGTPGWWRVETAKLADDLKDTKCVLVRTEAPAAALPGKLPPAPASSENHRPLEDS